MKRFIKLFCFFWLFLILAIACIRIAWILVTPRIMARNTLGKDIHTVVLGGSVGRAAWNDSIISGSKNLCGHAMTFGDALNNLKWATEYNENKPDTVILAAGLVSVAYFFDDVDVPEALLKRDEEKRNILNYSVFFNNYKHHFEYWEYILVSFPYKNLEAYKGVEGDFSTQDHNEINHPLAFNQINTAIERAHEYDKQGNMSEEYLKTYFTYQLDNLHKIKEYCDAHQLTLIILNTPMYKILDMASDKGYRQLICSELGDSTLVADYSHFKVPDSTYYRDPEHLNIKGAQFFGEHIEKEGLELQYAIDFCMN